jgi:hypothetical protein
MKVTLLLQFHILQISVDVMGKRKLQLNPQITKSKISKIDSQIIQPTVSYFFLFRYLFNSKCL